MLFLFNHVSSIIYHYLFSMDNTPCWRGLMHFKSVASIQFTDGNAFKDILRAILPSAVDVLPADSAFAHCIHLLDQIEYLESSLPEYEKYCIILSQEYDKNYNYPKHHSLIDLPEDLRSKATVENYSTRPGEGFQQEVQQAYDQTNFRNPESQVLLLQTIRFPTLFNFISDD
ncbi:hypothetical protein M422DRAFT_170034 [Sphaerobolus stellatus SS14]|uniref:Uncharacterized protein n=1 Tax=Sphaerobolus stellatus (strain SS14) TaxID=990650 RepID=A0A0C9VXN4_SPHS4|nr:hypothetical protein M422DRAFT_170034 [Sphaerobolus stellatus SS14]